jgi:hypothetical protein
LSLDGQPSSPHLPRPVGQLARLPLVGVMGNPPARAAAFNPAARSHMRRFAIGDRPANSMPGSRAHRSAIER